MEISQGSTQMSEQRFRKGEQAYNITQIPIYYIYKMKSAPRSLSVCQRMQLKLDQRREKGSNAVILVALIVF